MMKLFSSFLYNHVISRERSEREIFALHNSKIPRFARNDTKITRINSDAASCLSIDWRIDYPHHQYPHHFSTSDVIASDLSSVALAKEEARQSRSFVAPLDKKFTATIKMLTKHNSKGPDAFFNPDDYENILAGKPL